MKFALKALLILVVCTNILLCAIDKNKVYLLCNSNIVDSLNLAKDYALLRDIPQRNIIALDMPVDEEISRADYNAKIVLPLMQKLSQLKAVSCEFAANDIIYISHDIDFIISCLGVPLKIKPDNNLSGLKTTAAAVDSDLSALFLLPKTGVVKNPLYSKDKELYKSNYVLRVARLAASNYQKSLSIVKNAIYAEENGLIGRAYVDDSKKIISKGDYLKDAENILRDLGYDISTSPDTPLFGFCDRSDAMAIYFGWYSINPCSYFRFKDFYMDKGSIAMHLFSFSARTLKSGWSVTLLDKNAAATVGNVYEPYLDLTHDFNLYLRALTLNFSAGEAAYFSTKALRWQNIFMGDPLYMPFKFGLDKQIEAINNGKISFESQYAIIRAMNLISKKSSAKSSIDFGKHYLSLGENIALKWKLSQLCEELGNIKKAKDYALSCVSILRESDNKYFGLCFEVAKFFMKNNMGVQALDICKNHIEKRWKDKNYLLETLPFMIEAANSANDEHFKELYTNKLQELKNPPKNGVQK